MLLCKEIALLILKNDSIVYFCDLILFSILLKWKCSIIRVLYLDLYPISIFLFLLQFGEWVFTVTGKGTLPQPQEPVSLSAPAGANTTVIIPFRNTLDCAVSVDVLLTGRYSVFCLHYNADNKRRIETQLSCALRFGIIIIVIS